jgi:Uma2 family endonuclease
MSYEEWLDWWGEWEKGEWIDGEVIVYPTRSTRHQLTLGFVISWLGSYLDLRPLGQLIMLSFELRVREGAALLPDLMVILNEHRARITEQRVEGTADLVIEVVEPESAERDRGMRFDEFAAAGVPEYWIIDPFEPNRSAELYRLGGEGRYIAVPPDEDGKLHSSVLPDVWIDPSWFTGDELPTGLELAFQMAGVEKWTAE